MLRTLAIFILHHYTDFTSEREVYKLAAQMRETGSVEPRTGNCGRKSKLSEEDLKRVDKAIQAQPDITFGELIMNLELDISESRLGRIVREKLGYSLKKKVIHASEQERPRCTGKASGMERTHERNTREKAGFSG